MKKSTLQLIAILCALAVFGFFGARLAGSLAKSATLERLETVWPHFETMPEAEHAFVVDLAVACNVVSRPAERAEVLACLRKASSAAGPQASARLESLLKGR